MGPDRRHTYQPDRNSSPTLPFSSYSVGVTACHWRSHLGVRRKSIPGVFLPGLAAIQIGKPAGEPLGFIACQYLFHYLALFRSVCQSNDSAAHDCNWSTFNLWRWVSLFVCLSKDQKYYCPLVGAHADRCHIYPCRRDGFYSTSDVRRLDYLSASLFSTP